MQYSDDRLEEIFEKSGEECEYCGKQLAWGNYGREGFRGAWEVDHRNPVSRGGTDHLNNLAASCIDCNRAKADMTAREFQSLFETSSSRPSTSGFWEAVLTLGSIAFGVWLLKRAFEGRNQQH